MRSYGISPLTCRSSRQQQSTCPRIHSFPCRPGKPLQGDGHSCKTSVLKHSFFTPPCFRDSSVKILYLTYPTKVSRHVGLLFERADAIDHEVAAADRRSEMPSPTRGDSLRRMLGRSSRDDAGGAGASLRWQILTVDERGTYPFHAMGGG